MPILQKKWLLDNIVDSIYTTEENKQAEMLDIEPLLLKILRKRGLNDFKLLDEFLYPNLRNLAKPEFWHNLENCADLIVKSLLEGKKPVIYGDYDVDGITGTVLALQVLKFHGYEPHYYLPKRTEGYGLNLAAIEELSKSYQLLITVDCAISDYEPIKRANELGFTSIITDHHVPPEELPPAHAIFNPKIGVCPCPDLAGVGAIFYVMAAVNSRLSEHTGKKMDMREVLDLVALGTLADIVPLTGQNRILVKNGLLVIKAAKRPGLAELKAISGYERSANIGSWQAVFGLAPRINAIGRMGSAHKAVEMFMSNSYDEAAIYANELNDANKERQEEEKRIFEEALEQIKPYENDFGFVLYGANWHQGVIGIVASQIMDIYHRPLLVLCNDNGELKGSGRSISDFDLYEALCSCSDLLLKYGGHRQAAGLRLKAENLEALRTRFNELAREKFNNSYPMPNLRVDSELNFSLASDFNFLKSLESLQPFGMSNSEPNFLSPKLILRKKRKLGRVGNHLQLELLDTTTNICLHAKLWNMYDQFAHIEAGVNMQIVYTPGINNFNGVSNVELKVRDWRLI